MSYIDSFIERGFRSTDHKDGMLKKSVIDKAVSLPSEIKLRSELFSRPTEEVLEEIELDWVTVSDPRFAGSLPSLELAAVVTSSVKSSAPMLRLYGRNPDDNSVSHLGTVYNLNGNPDESKLVLSVDPDGGYSEVSWHSIDAEVFLKLADQVLDGMTEKAAA